MAAYEVVPAFALIVGAICLMGGAHAGVHHLFYGKPKPTSVDDWDRLMFRRDAEMKKADKAA